MKNYRYRMTALGALFACMGSGGAVADAPGLSVTEPFGIEAASRLADEDALIALTQSPFDDVRWLSSALLLRIHGQLKESDESAAKCYQSAVQNNHFMTATRCLTITAGNAYLRGNDTSAVDIFSRVRALFNERVAPTIPKGTHYWPADFSPEGTSFTQAQTAKPATSIKPGHYAFSWLKGSVPLVELTINGTTQPALFDTGSYKSAIASDLASRLTLTEDGQWLGGRPNGSFSYMPRYVGDAQLFGTSLGKHSFAGISSSGLAILGLDIMQAIGTFQISSSGIDVLDPNAPEAKQCKDPMLLGSTLDGTVSGLYVPIVANGTNSRALLDTGDSGALMQYVGTAPIHWPASAWTRQDASRANFRETSSFHMVDGYMRIGQSAWLQGKIQMSTSDREEPGTFHLGAASLHQVRYVFDFPRHHLCAYATNA